MTLETPCVSWRRRLEGSIRRFSLLGCPRHWMQRRSYQDSLSVARSSGTAGAIGTQAMGSRRTGRGPRTPYLCTVSSRSIRYGTKPSQMPPRSRCSPCIETPRCWVFTTMKYPFHQATETTVYATAMPWECHEKSAVPRKSLILWRARCDSNARPLAPESGCQYRLSAAFSDFRGIQSGVFRGLKVLYMPRR